MEQTVNTGAEAPKRPQFITVLCILTWVGCGIGLIMSIVGWMGARAAGAMMDVAGSMADAQGMENMPGMQEAMNALKYANILLIIGVVGTLLCLFGSIQMWKLKKTGFYIYVVGELAPAIATMVLMGGMAGAMGIVGLIVPILFVVLYGMNLKHMN
jgi:hypothetical protein